MRPHRVSRRAISASVGVMAAPVLATLWLILGQDAHPGPTRSSERPASTGPEQRMSSQAGAAQHGPTPELHLARPSAEVAAATLREQAGTKIADPGVRYIAIRELERRADETSVEEAEAIVLAAGADQPGRFLAVNALAVLARSRDGLAALARCAERAPSEELRQASRTLLSRKSSVEAR